MKGYISNLPFKDGDDIVAILCKIDSTNNTNFITMLTPICLPLYGKYNIKNNNIILNGNYINKSTINVFKKLFNVPTIDYIIAAFDRFNDNIYYKDDGKLLFPLAAQYILHDNLPLYSGITTWTMIKNNFCIVYEHTIIFEKIGILTNVINFSEPLDFVKYNLYNYISEYDTRSTQRFYYNITHTNILTLKNLINWDRINELRDLQNN